MSLPAEAIDRARHADILEVARRYVTLKPVSASEWAGPCPACGGKDRFSVNTRKRIWNCRGCGKGGDVIALVQHVEGVGFREAVERLADERWTPKRRAPPTTQKGVDKGDDLNLRLASVLWDDALLLGDEAKAYFAHRGIDIDAVPARGGLRWHPRCPWRGAKAPCVLARFTDVVTGEPRGVWRRRIDDPTEKPRTLGPMKGSVVRLWADEEVANGLVIGEGVETVLAAATRIKRRNGALLHPAWACGGSGNLSAFPVLAPIETLTILVDNDADGGGQRAAEACAERWLDAGRDVVRLTPKLPGDFNDIVRRERAA
jgi:phage/plasmid primase-like uncharacterized protein